MGAEHVKDDEFEAAVLNCDKPVLVDFWAEWCGPCRMLSPIIEEVAEELGDKVKVFKLNVDENQETAAKYQVMSIPNVIMYKDGEVVESWVGVRPKDQYLEGVKAKLGDKD